MATAGRWWTGVAIGLMYVVTFACKKKPPEPSCDERTRALAVWMESLASEGEPVPRGTLVALDDPPQVGVDGVEIELDAGRVTLGGTSSASTSDPATLLNELKSWRKTSEDVRRFRPQKESDLPVRLSIRPNTRWLDAVTLFEALGKAGVQRVGFVFIAKSLLLPPAETSISRYFQEHPQSVKDQSWSKPFTAPTRAFLQCPEVVVSIGATSGESLDPSQRTRMLAELPPSIRECHCKVDVEEVKAALWAAYQRYDKAPTLTHTVLVGTRGAAGVVAVEASAVESWEKVAPRVTAASAKHSPIFLGVATSP